MLHYTSHDTNMPNFAISAAAPRPQPQSLWHIHVVLTATLLFPTDAALGAKNAHVSVDYGTSKYSCKEKAPSPPSQSLQPSSFPLSTSLLLMVLQCLFIQNITDINNSGTNHILLTTVQVIQRTLKKVQYTTVKMDVHYMHTYRVWFIVCQCIYLRNTCENQLENTSFCWGYQV